MQEPRGETIQRGGYIDDGTHSKPREVQMRNYNREPDTIGRYYESRQPTDRQPERVKEEESVIGYCVHLAAFAVAMLFYFIAWAIDYYAVGRQATTYYYNNYAVCPYMDTTTYTDSTTIYTSIYYRDTAGVVMAILYGWVLWKGPLLAYTLHLTAHQQNTCMRVGSWVATAIILLVIDILCTTFALSFYGDWFFFLFYFLFTIIVAAINNNTQGRIKETLANTLIPLCIIAFLYCLYTLFLPSLYKAYSENETTMTTAFLIIYLYPFFDLAIYSLTLYLGTKVQLDVKSFFSMIHFLMIGYGIGIILNTGYTEVQFYYLLAYFIFRNVFVNFIMRRWEKVVSNPPALPCWVICYYLGYALSFLPLIGLGKVVVAKSFSTYIYALTPPILYSSSNPLYSSKDPPTGALATNWGFDGRMFWLAGILIWLAMTFSQRYDRKFPRLYDFFYYLVGIYLFYTGLASSISLSCLSTYGHL